MPRCGAVFLQIRITRCYTSPRRRHPTRTTQPQTSRQRPAVHADDKTTPKLTVHIPVDARGAALAILATVGLVFGLQIAEKFLIPLLLGILIAYTLNPLVVWLQSLKCPRILASSVVVIGVAGALGLVTYSGWGQMQLILDQLPTAAAKFSTLMSGNNDTVQKVQAAANELEKATNQAAGAAAKPVVTPVLMEQHAFRLSDFLWAGSLGAMGFLSQTVMVLFLVFFLLASGDIFKRKLIKLAGPKLSRKKVTVNLLDDINDSIQRYMFMLLVTNLLVALLTWVAFRWIGLENAGAWSIAAALLHVIPYFGPAVIAVTTAMAAFMQFDSLPTALLVSGTSLAIAALVGILITTWMAGRIARMNSAAVFISLLFWAWLWGIWGMLLAIPITVIVKVVSEHVEEFRPLAELLGD
jgi:predicted PurR-regulated permease PerM